MTLDGNEINPESEALFLLDVTLLMLSFHFCSFFFFISFDRNKSSGAHTDYGI